MICRSCGNENAYQVRTVYDKGETIDYCNRPECGNLASIDAGVPDVYLGHIGQKFESLCDEQGRPYEITSKRQKKEIMNRLGVSEAGDRINGAPFGTKTWIDGSREWRRKQFDKDRPMIRENYRRYLERARGK